MPKGFDNLLTILFTAVLLAGLVLYVRPDPQAANYAPNRAVAMVAQAQQIIAASDIASAVQAFDRNHDFNTQGVYLFVLDADGHNIYHAADRTLIGTDFAILIDKDGRRYGQNLIRDTAAAGVWHAHRLRKGWHLTYARKTPRGHIIAAAFMTPH